MPENTRIEKTFTYKVPDMYLHEEDTLGKVNTWTYTGPDKLWIFVDKETRKIISRFHYTERDNGAEVPTPEDQWKVLVDANQNPLLASMIHNEVDYGTLPHDVETLPDGSTYGCPNPLPPDHTYELTEVELDPSTMTFITPYPWKKPHMDWPTLIDVRNNLLKASDQFYRMAAEEDKSAWEEYRQKLRDLPDTFAGVDPWKVPFPQQPTV